MDLWASHLPVLVAAVAATRGPVLELGAGWYSTPVLHALCHGGRRLVTVETDAAWLVHFADLATANHRLAAAATATDWHREQWAVVFVDGRPAKLRRHHIVGLRGRADLFVVHDTEPEHAASYDWGGVLDGFAARWDHRRWPAWTTALSDDPGLVAAVRSRVTE